MLAPAQLLNGGFPAGFAIGMTGSVLYVDSTLGNDSTGLPFKTIKAAHDYAAAAGGTWLLRVAPGAYTNETGLNNVLVNYHFEPGAVLTLTAGNVSCFSPSSATAAKMWGVYGHGKFIVNNPAGTGGILNFQASAVDSIAFHADTVYVQQSAGGYNTGAIYFYGSLTGINNGHFDIDIRDFSSAANMASLYARGGAKYFLKSDFCSRVEADGNFDIKALVNEAHKWYIGRNNFGTGQLRLVTNRGMKGSDGEPALSVRTGNVMIEGGCVYSGGGAPSGSRATLLEITAQSNAEAATVNVLFRNCTLAQWSGSGNGSAIRFPAYSGAYVGLMNCHLPSAPGDATVASITSTGAVGQTVESLGGGNTARVGVSADITIRGPALTVNAAFASSNLLP